MKKLVIALCFLTTTLFAQAQDSKADKVLQKYRFGLFIAPGTSWLKPTSSTVDMYNVTKNGGNISFSLGLNAEFGSNERYAFYTGLSIDWLGGSITSTFDSAKNTFTAVDYVKYADVKYKLQYLTVPLGLKLKAVNIDKIRIFGQLGMDAGILIGRKADYTMRTSSNTTTEATKYKLEATAMSPLNVGWQIGVGAEYDITKRNAVYGAILYHNGFLPDITIPKNNATGLRFADGNVRSNNISLRIGYFF